MIQSVTDGFPSQKGCDAESIPMLWYHINIVIASIFDVHDAHHGAICQACVNISWWFYPYGLIFSGIFHWEGEKDVLLCLDLSNPISVISVLLNTKLQQWQGEKCQQNQIKAQPKTGWAIIIHARAVFSIGNVRESTQLSRAWIPQYSCSILALPHDGVC